MTAAVDAFLAAPGGRKVCPWLTFSQKLRNLTSWGWTLLNSPSEFGTIHFKTLAPMLAMDP
jgi:hypothetical protein